ncbi:Cytochrome c oxidase assembly protein COX19 [Tolypocladium capitatum]|uniref:Cytochrome c oxidase assembly protein COX19 n=1 Tax=Tolypocladium capitatum TaxID=45235 RepID=A0A2K3QKY0_9HYPO|nr:Cytochrome c oxidase assembly protein COX19 [Tolypocladium capitatum]
MRKSADAKARKASPPSPSYMSNEQFGTAREEDPVQGSTLTRFASTANYLSDLRANRIARPGGARPQPSQPGQPSHAATSRYSLDATFPAASLPGHRPTPSQTPSIAATSISSRYSTASARGRDYYPTKPTAPLKPSDVVPTATYMERGQRWMEKEEAVSLRDAMEEMDIRKAVQEAPDDEIRIYTAALNEAAELVWQHERGGNNAPRPPDGPYRYKPHLRKNSYAHARTASIGADADEVAPSGLGRDMGSRSVSRSSTESDGSGTSQAPRRSTESTQSTANNSRKHKPYGSIGAANRRTSLKRNISGEVERPFSGDQIWEEPEAPSPNHVTLAGRASPDKLSSKPQNPVNRVRAGPPPGGANSTKPLNRFEIHRNPPSQSRDPRYTTNSPLPTSTPETLVEGKNGMEVRGDDIRAATSRRLKDRSSKLPEPTAVSDSPGRPIVSFNANWKAPGESTDVNPAPNSSFNDRGQSGYQSAVIPSITVAEDNTPQPRQTPHAGVPSISIAGPDDTPRSSVPTINVPTIAVDETPDNSSVPATVTPDDKPANRTRPLPNPGAPGSHARRVARPRGHWSPAPGAMGRTAATCHECGFPIEGRFVALAGSPERFHPQCFCCFTCGTSLEAMEISPEPDHVRSRRLERIRLREAGEVLAELPGMTMAEDGDDRLRFYCHLDWHEFFAPRCKHCKTPILGEHIVALGQHWHYGHFFCAECGDPFEHGTTHIEKDGYAWCINCQTKRTERQAPKCKRCKAAVIGQYIQALGSEWHEHCFRCAECQGGFDDGQIFPKDAPGGTVVLCTACRTRELKS